MTEVILDSRHTAVKHKSRALSCVWRIAPLYSPLQMRSPAARAGAHWERGSCRFFFRRADVIINDQSLGNTL